MIANDRIIKINLNIQLQLVRRRQARRAAIRQADANLIQNNQLRARLCQHGLACAFQQFNDGPCAAIQNWHLRPVNLNQHIVNAGAKQGRHEMLNRAHPHLVRIFHLGAEPTFNRIIDAGRDDIIAVGNISADKHHTMISLSWQQAHRNKATGMDTDTTGSDWLLQTCLHHLIAALLNPLGDLPLEQICHQGRFSAWVPHS